MKSIFVHNDSYLFVYFIDVRIFIKNQNYTLLIPCLSFWSERHSFSHSITSFSYIFVLFGVSKFFKFHTSSAPFLLLLLLLLLLLAFRDDRYINMLTQNILPSSFIFIQKQKTYPIPKLYLFLINLVVVNVR